MLGGEILSGNCTIKLTIEWGVSRVKNKCLLLNVAKLLILNLIKTHAILHQKNLVSNDEGYITAQLEDYTAIYNLVSEIISEGLGVMVSDTVRQTVDAVRLINEGKCSVTDNAYGLTDCSPSKLIEVAQQLGIDKSSASRRVKQAIKLGYLINSETIKGKPMSLVIGDPLPEEQKVIPSPDHLMRRLMHAKIKTVAQD